jgi:CBS domain-containing protein
MSTTLKSVRTPKHFSTWFDKPVSKFLQPPIIVNADDTVEDAARLMREKQVGSLIVAEKVGSSVSRKEPVGILTEWDLVSRVTAEGKDAARTRVREVMSSPLIKVDLRVRVGDAIRMMTERGIRRLAVCDGQVLAGILTQSQMVGNRRGSSSPLPLVEPLRGHLCPYCSLTFRTRNKLSNHIQSTHAKTLRLEKAEESEEQSF